MNVVVEPNKLHDHSDLRLGTMFRKHTILGETFEQALSTLADPELKEELRRQFGASIDAICDELEEEDLSGSSDSDSDSESETQSKKRKRKPVEMTSIIELSDGLRGTFHYQTSSQTRLTTPVESDEWKIPFDAEESAMLQKGASLEQARGLIPAKAKDYEHLTKEEINTILSKDTTGRYTIGETYEEALKKITMLHNHRIDFIEAYGYVEKIGKVDIWCAKA